MKFFYKDVELDVPESVYFPREDSELLAGVIENMRLRNKDVLEIGCGSGFLSIIMAKKHARVTAVDINPAAVETTTANAKNNHVHLVARVSYLFDRVEGKFDLVVFNPPYLPVDEGEEDETYSGGLTGREIIEVFVSYAGNHLKSGGRILMIISSLTGEEEVLALLRGSGMKASVKARKKVWWEELVVIEAIKELQEAR